MKHLFYTIFLVTILVACDKAEALAPETQNAGEPSQEKQTESNENVKVYELKEITIHSYLLGTDGLILTEDFNQKITLKEKKLDIRLYDFLDSVYWPGKEKERKEYLEKFTNYLPEEKPQLYHGFTTVYAKNMDVHSFQTIVLDEMVMIKFKSRDVYKRGYSITHIYRRVKGAEK